MPITITFPDIICSSIRIRWFQVFVSVNIPDYLHLFINWFHVKIDGSTIPNLNIHLKEMKSSSRKRRCKAITPPLD